MQLELHPEATSEAREARLWYAERSSEAATRFFLELERALDLIAESPSRWPVRAGVRKYVMRRFPFVIVFRVHDSTVEVLAIAHARRRPGYWKERARGRA